MESTDLLHMEQHHKRQCIRCHHISGTIQPKTLQIHGNNDQLEYPLKWKDFDRNCKTQEHIIYFYRPSITTIPIQRRR
jgi:hypothetical protein